MPPHLSNRVKYLEKIHEWNMTIFNLHCASAMAYGIFPHGVNGGGLRGVLGLGAPLGKLFSMAEQKWGFGTKEYQKC